MLHIYPLLSWGTFGLFLLSGKNYALFMYKLLCEHMCLFFLGMYLGLELLSQVIIPCLTFWRTARFFQSNCTILHSCQQWISVSPFTHQHLISCLSYCKHPGGYEVITPCGLICISLVTNSAQQLFMCLLVICMFSLEKYLFWSFADFKNRVVFIIEL